MKRQVKAILIDVLGFSLIIAAIPISWLPGPGGIPLLIIGLSLLANNHEWAERLLQKVKDGGLKIFDKVFDGSATTRWLVDIATVVVITGAVLLVLYATKNFARTAGISFIIAATIMFFSNRRRYQRLWNKIRRDKHKH